MSTHRTKSQNKARRGGVLVYVAVGTIGLGALASLAVDFGRVQLVKSELSAAADAVALAAARDLPYSSTALATATSTAAQNYADGATISLSNSSITFGYWSGTTFSTSGSGTYNAVKVDLSRIGNDGVPLTFGHWIGMDRGNASASAIAYKTSGNDWGFVGLDAVSWNGTAVWLDIWKYDSNDSSYTFQPTKIASNGTVTIDGTCLVRGDIYYGAGTALNISSSSDFSGNTYTQSSTLTMPDPTADGADSTNSNASIPAGVISSAGAMPSIGKTSSGTTNIVGGTYWVNNVNITNGTVKFTGAATLLVNGTFNLANSKIVTYQSKPKNLVIKMMGTGTFSMTNPTADTFADIYAPKSAYVYNGMTDLWGRGIFKSINVTGAGCMLHDKQLVPTSSGGSVKLVK